MEMTTNRKLKYRAYARPKYDQEYDPDQFNSSYVNEMESI